MAEYESSAYSALAQKSVKQAEPVAVTEDTATPEEHALATGNGPAGGELTLSFNGVQERARFSWQHEAASALHGWKDHEHDADEPMQLTRAAYLAALEAACEPEHAACCPKRGQVIGDKDPAKNAQILAEHGQYAPAPEALSPYSHLAKLAKATEQAQ